MAGRALSFEPQFRFGLDGKPWSFLFWWRYRLLEGRRLHVGVGAHPAIVFRTTTVASGGTQRDVIEARRYLAGEIQPSYALSPHAAVGTYYLFSYGLEQNVAKHTHFLALRANVTTGELPAGVVVRFGPQAYYLRTDRRDGSYVNAALTVSRRNFPLSISAMMNRTVRSDIVGEDFLWNVSLMYAFQLGR